MVNTKKLPIIDTATGLEIQEHFVEKRAANHLELEGETWGLGSDNFLTIPNKISKHNTPNLMKSTVDGTIQLFPPIVAGTEVFLNHIDFSKSKQDTTFIYEDNKEIVYRNGQKGLRHSLNIFPCMSHDDTRKKRMTWKDIPIPDYLYNKKGIRNREMTVFIKLGEPVNTGLHRIAFRLGGAWNVNPVLRSFVEIGYPTQDYPDIYFDVAYAAGKNVLLGTINQYFAGDRVVPHKWLGLKIVSQVAENKSHVWYGLYVDLNPFQDDNFVVPSNNWQLKADIIFTGVKEYQNIIPSWKSEVDSIIVDGYESVEFKNVTDREVDFLGLKPLHHDLSVITSHNEDSNRPIFRKAMIPQINLDDFELKEDIINNNDITSRKASHTKLSLPRADRDSNPKDPAFYGNYTH